MSGCFPSYQGYNSEDIAAMQLEAGICVSCAARIEKLEKRIEELENKINSDAKPEPKKQKFELHDRVICYSYERFAGRISAIDIDKYRIENDEGDGHWVHEKQLRRIKKK